MQKIIKTEVYIQKYEGYIAYLHTFEDGVLMLEYLLEFPDGTPPCLIKKRIKKVERAYEYICLLDEYDKKTKRPKKTKSVQSGSRAKDGI